jgi:hypothetical protein
MTSPLRLAGAHFARPDQFKNAHRTGKPIDRVLAGIVAARSDAPGLDPEPVTVPKLVDRVGDQRHDPSPLVRGRRRRRT